ncbi:MAG: hypothetical protein R2909_00405 [Gemmatimonadales bacterium]
MEPVKPAASPRSRFFVWMAGYCLLLTIAGFTPTYWAPLTTGSLEGLSPAVHVHGALFFCWTLLFFVQSRLVAGGRVETHRSLGLLGVSLATAMVIFGFIVSLNANVERIEAGQVARAYALGFSNSFALLAFAALFALAVSKRKRPASHKRLMLFATCMLLNPPVGRLFRPVFAPAPPRPWAVFATIDVILLACVVYDLKTIRRLHPVTIGAGVALLAFQILRFPLPRMAWWHATYDALLRLVG